MSVSSELHRKIRFGDFEVNLLTAELRTKGQKLTLQGQPFQILTVLLEHPGELVTREELRKRLWTSDTFVDFEHNLNKAVNRLREALGDSAENPKFVETLPRKGYRWIGPALNDGDSAPDKRESLAVQTTGTAPTSVGKGESRRRKYRDLGIFFGVAVVAALIGGFVVLRPRRPPPLTEKDSVVVADFVNSTGDPIFDDTLRQGLSAQLSQSPFFNLLSDQRISETLKLMGQTPGSRLTPEVAREICVRSGGKVLLAGSISSLGSQYVIGLKAVNCNSGEVLAQEQVQSGAREAVLKMLGQETARLRQELGESLSSIRRFKVADLVTTPSLDALKAWSAAETVRSEKGDRACLPFLRRAVELDPEFAMAHAKLATVHINLQETSLSTASMEKAYALRERVSEKEKYYIDSHYYEFATGEMERASQVYELWGQTYPRSSTPLVQLSGIHLTMGQYETAVNESLEALRREPDNYVAYTNLILTYTSLNRLDDAKATYQKMLLNKIEYPDVHVSVYGIAAAQRDGAEMRRQVAWADGKLGIEDILLAEQADTEAFYGRLSEAREFSRRAIESAQRADKRETAALWRMNEALREGEFGNFQAARQGAADAMALASTRDVQSLAALMLAQSGDVTQSQKISKDLARRHSRDTLINGYWLPSIRAAIALSQDRPAEAIKLLHEAAQYELGADPFTAGFVSPLHPAYIRGEAYLRLHRGKEAAAEYQKFVDHWGAVKTFPLGALARLGLGRAYAMQGDSTKARAAYQDFFTLWKDADPEIPILKQAKAEYADLLQGWDLSHLNHCRLKIRAEFVSVVNR